MHLCRGPRVFLRPKIEIDSQVMDAPEGAFQAAVRLINEKRTILLAFQDDQGRLPGEAPEYVAYLQGVLARNQVRDWPGFGARKPDVFSVRMRSGDGLSKCVAWGRNQSSQSRPRGAFPGLDSAAAWKGFALCVACADLLYVYWNHVAADYLATIAGYNALIIPSLHFDPATRKKFAKRLREWIAGIDKTKDTVVVREKQLLNILGDDKAVATLNILWAEFGQRIDDIRGIVTDILPSRLRQLTEVNNQFNKPTPPVFPDWPLEEFEYNLPLTVLRSLLRRPGGKAAQNSNESRRLFDLRRDLVEAIYHVGPMPLQFADEIHITAQWHFSDVCESGNAWGLLHEGRTKDGKTFLTAAGWVRQLAWFWHYLRLIGVIFYARLTRTLSTHL